MVVTMSEERDPSMPEAAAVPNSAGPTGPTGPGTTRSPATPGAYGHLHAGRRPVIMTALLGAAALAGCGAQEASSGSPQASQPAPATAPPSQTGASPSEAPGSAAPSATDPSSPDPLEGWSLEEKVGQLIMVGVEADAPSPLASAAITDHHVGGLFIAGRTRAGSQAISTLVGSLTGLLPTTGDRPPLLVATDQEGGQVQVLSGPGFSPIPSAEQQAVLPTDQLLASARTWGQELAACGVTMNLAPAADLVDVVDPASNEPIGRWGRHYGRDAASVSAQAMAFAQGMGEAGVLAVYKHFPGLGRVVENTDTTAGVTDTTTSRSGDAAVSVFASAISGGAQVIMMSSATYTLIDASAPAVFSPTIVTDMLRGDMGFTGVIMTDDASTAVQLQQWEPGERAVRAVRAGCDLVLASADASTAAPMAQALVAAAQADPSLAARVDESARRILALKNSQ